MDQKFAIYDVWVKGDKECSAPIEVFDSEEMAHQEFVRVIKGSKHHPAWEWCEIRESTFDMNVPVGVCPKGPHLLVPFGGWHSKNFYIVNISPSTRTPVYEAILYTGNLSEDGSLNATCRIWSPIEGEYGDHPSSLLYLKMVSNIDGI